MTLALKPAMVLPPGQTTRRLSKRKRESDHSENEGELVEQGGTWLPW